MSILTGNISARRGWKLVTSWRCCLHGHPSLCSATSVVSKELMSCLTWLLFTFRKFSLVFSLFYDCISELFPQCYKHCKLSVRYRNSIFGSKIPFIHAWICDVDVDIGWIRNGRRKQEAESSRNKQKEQATCRGGMSSSLKCPFLPCFWAPISVSLFNFFKCIPNLSLQVINHNTTHYSI